MDYPKTKKNNLEYTYTSHPFAFEVCAWADGKKFLKLNAPAWYRHFVQTKMKVGDNGSMVITNRKPKRTTNQNKFYWAYLGEIAQQTGHTPEQIHAWAKKRFLAHTSSVVFGDEVSIEASTTDQSVGDFCEYIANIFMETGIEPPDSESYNLERMDYPQEKLVDPDEEVIQ